jgi:hypothetical protein
MVNKVLTADSSASIVIYERCARPDILRVGIEVLKRRDAKTPSRARYRSMPIKDLQMLHVEDAFDHLPRLFVDLFAGLARAILHLHEEAAFLLYAPSI